MDLPPDARRQLLQHTQTSWPGTLRTIATTEGPVTIGPHHTAYGLLGALVEMGAATSDVQSDYGRAAGAALTKLTGDLPPQSAIAFSLAAFHGNDGNSS